MELNVIKTTWTTSESNFREKQKKGPVCTKSAQPLLFLFRESEVCTVCCSAAQPGGGTRETPHLKSLRDQRNPHLKSLSQEAGEIPPSQVSQEAEEPPPQISQGAEEPPSQVSIQGVWVQTAFIGGLKKSPRAGGGSSFLSTWRKPYSGAALQRLITLMLGVNVNT